MENKVGDFVRITKPYCQNTRCVDKIGKIVYIGIDFGLGSIYDIEFDFEFPGGHSGESRNGKYGHTWSYREGYFEPLNSLRVDIL